MLDLNWIARETIDSHRASQRYEEFRALLGLIDRPNRVLEVGTEFGGTLWAWCQIAHDDATIVSVDQNHDVCETIEGRADQRLVHVTGDSHAEATRELARRELAAEHGHRPSAYLGADFLFIDGDHSYEGVKRDWEMYGPLVRPGGLVAFHDIDCLHEVRDFWRELEGDFTRLLLYTDSPELERGFGIGVVWP